MVCWLKNVKDLSNLEYEKDENVNLDPKGGAPGNYSLLVSQAIRDLFL